MPNSAHTTIATNGARPKRRRSTKPRISTREAARLLALRDRLEQHLETMIGFLDEMDGDADLEPSLGSRPPHQQVTQDIWSEGTTDDREQECEDEGAGNEDNEPSLGWPETGSRGQSFRNMGGPHDYEEDCEDEGAMCDDEGCTKTDDEPSLGSIENHPGLHGGGSQVGWSAGSFEADLEGEHDGREPDCEDEGAQCEDEGAQCDTSYDEACGGLV